jgi:hypothetical protein
MGAAKLRNTVERRFATWTWLHTHMHVSSPRCLHDFVTFEEGIVSIKAGPFHTLLSDQMENGQPLEVEMLKFAASSGGGSREQARRQLFLFEEIIG